MEKLKTALKNKNIDHIYFFSGEEVYLTNYYSKALKDVVGCDDTFDYVVLDAENITGLQEAIESMPLMSQKKMVVVKGQDLSSELKPEDVEMITALLEDVPSFTELLFVTRTINKNSKIYKLLTEKSTVCTFEHQKPAEVIKWIMKVASTKNVKIDRDTSALLIEFAGIDMTTLISELDKLSSYCVDSGIVTADAVERIVIKSVDAKIYYLLDAVFGGNSEQSFRLLEEFKAENESSIYINASIMGTIRTLLEHAYLQREGMSVPAISDKLRLRPIQAKKNTGYLKKVDVKFLENILKRCTALDMEMKRGADGFSGLSLILGEILLKTSK
ncbi:MAG: DNA polymerase III subunit delta [Clostridia bacterium]|nr:DNA polymerase III subunit delta [Clostridia bacterium]